MDKYQRLGIKSSIFGDPLGNRGEYSKGIFYSGRRRYLYDEASQLPPMEPPRDMMTNKQKRKSCIKTTQGVPLIQRLDFKRAGDQADRGNSKKLDHKKKNTLVITKVPTRPEDWTLKTQAGCKFWVHNRTGEASTTCPYDSNQSSFPIPQSRSMTPIHRSLFAPTPSPTKSESPSSSPQCSSPQQLPSDEMGIMLEPDDESRFRSSTFQSPRLFDGDEETNVGTGLGALIYDTSEYQDLLRALDASLSLSPSKGTTNSNIRSSL